MLPFIDAHAHIDRFPDPFAAVGAATAAGCLAIISCGYDLPSSRAALRIAREHPGIVFPAVGLAPTTVIDWEPAQFESEFSYIQENAAACVAIGEVGLDYHWATKPVQIEAQKAYLSRQLDLAEEKRLPLVIHSRKAEADVLATIKERRIKDVLLHFFSGSPALVKEASALGCCFSVPPIHSRSRTAAIQEMPLDRILLESDAPYVGAAPETALLSAEIVSEAKGISIGDALKASIVNSKRFYHLKLKG